MKRLGGGGKCFLMMMFGRNFENALFFNICFDSFDLYEESEGGCVDVSFCQCLILFARKLIR